LGIKHALSSRWFNRIALISWIIGAVSVFVIFKNIELIVHGQLYNYGLTFSTDWASPFLFYTLLIYVCLGLPMALSGVALIFSFYREAKTPEKRPMVQQKVRMPQQAPRVAAQSPVREPPPKVVVENGSGGISCPHCHKVFSRALVMLDFRGGKHKLVSVCPYCNYVLGNTSEQKRADVNLQVNNSANPDEKVKT
jgi:hypothetical protein